MTAISPASCVVVMHEGVWFQKEILIKSSDKMTAMKTLTILLR